jgi:hypothetical protein
MILKWIKQRKQVLGSVIFLFDMLDYSKMNKRYLSNIGCLDGLVGEYKKHRSRIRAIMMKSEVLSDDAYLFGISINRIEYIYMKMLRDGWHSGLLFGHVMYFILILQR